MAVPSYEGVVTASGSSGTSTTIDISTIDGGSPPSNGDLLLVHYVRFSGSTSSDQHFNAPAGWHRLGSSQNNLASGFLWKIREAGDGNSVAISWGFSTSWLIAIHCIRGVDQARPICRHSIQRNDSDTWSWLAETTPVADCFAVALAAIDANRSGTTPASGWTERADAGIGSVGMYCQTQDFATVSTSTGTASTTIGGSGVEQLTQHMLLIQPPQTATPKDIRVATGTLTSPTATGNQDITGLGFACKALIVYGMRQNADAAIDDAEYMHGIGADDGVNSAAQRCAGMWHSLLNPALGTGWSRNGEIISMAIPTSAAPGLLATYSRITDGFRLNWATVQASGYEFHYIALGGDDLEAVCGAIAASAGAITDLPWRLDLAHFVGQCHNTDADQARQGAISSGTVSVGWLDPNAGAQWNVAIQPGSCVSLRDNAFYSQAASGALTYDLQFSQATATGFSWTGTDTDFFFYLALRLGGTTYFPAQVEVQRADASGSAGADQVVPAFGTGQTLTTKKFVHSMAGRNSTSVSTLSAGSEGIGLSEGHVKFSYAVVDQGSFAFGKNGTGVSATSRRRHKPNNAFLIPTPAGDLTSPGKIGAWQNDLVTIDWATNDTVGNLIGLFTLGFIGQEYTRSANDTVAVTDRAGRSFLRAINDTAVVVTDSLTRTATYGRKPTETAVVTDALTRATVSVRKPTETAVVTDSIIRTTTYGRKPTETAVVTDLLARTATYGRKPTETAVVTDLLARTATYGRKPIETAVVTDALTRAASSVRASNDTAVVTDLIARTATYGRKPNDTVAVADALTRSASSIRALNDTAVVTDLIARTATYGRKPSDTAVVADLLTRAASSVRALNDTAVVTDLIARTATYGRRISDTTTVTDVVSRAALFGRSANDTASVTDATARAASFARVVSDTVSLVEVVTRPTSSAHAANDTVLVADALTRAASSVRALNDTVLVTDEIRAAAAHALIINDALVAVDLVSASLERAIVVAVNDSANVADALIREVGTSRPVSDAASVADALALVHDAHRVVVDAVSAEDVVTVSAATVVELSDAIGIADSVALEVVVVVALVDGAVVTDQLVVTLGVGFSIAVSDVVAASDLVARVVAYVRVPVDAVATTDSIVTEQIGFEVEASDVVAVADAVAVAFAVGKSLSDSVAFVDALSVVRVYGGGASDTVSISDSLVTAILKLGADLVATTDSLRIASSYTRPASDSIAVEDSVVEGAIVFVPYGVDASVGPIIMYTIENSGPLAISGGPDLSTGPVGFVKNAGDFVTVTDSVEAT